jgi:hypothetical protein
VTACVFLGPTLPVAQAREVLTAEYLPPVRQGDVYRAVVRRRPRAIGIVDGYFRQVPSVWHKEILWAMAEGVHVFGSASMGALRAVELEPFGMRGVGEIFAAFRDQGLEDDDEVAVIHGPPEMGFLAASESMVNIRRTLQNARSEAVVSLSTQTSLEGIAKSLFYPWRDYPEIIKRGIAEGLPENELSALSVWLDHGRVDLKRKDALEMLVCMRDLLADDPAPKRVTYAFEHTTMWEAATAPVDTMEDASAGDPSRSLEARVLDEARLDGAVYDDLKRAALLRLLALREAERRHVDVDPNEFKEFATDFRLRHGLHRGSDLDQWLADRALDRRDFERLLKDEVLVNKLSDALRGPMERCAIDQLRISGDYARLVDRARAKRQALLAADDNGNSDEGGLAELNALAWYFRDRFGAQLPNDVDAYAARLGFKKGAAFRRAVLDEFRLHLLSREAHSE